MKRKKAKQEGRIREVETLEQRLAKHPALKEQIESLLAIVENREGKLEKADDAEGAVIGQLRPLGQKALGEWAQKQADRKAEQLNPSASRDKKNLHWNSRLGRIQVVERQFRHGRRGKSLRPFPVTAEVKN